MSCCEQDIEIWLSVMGRCEEDIETWRSVLGCRELELGGQ